MTVLVASGLFTVQMMTVTAMLIMLINPFGTRLVLGSPHSGTPRTWDYEEDDRAGLEVRHHSPCSGTKPGQVTPSTLYVGLPLIYVASWNFSFPRGTPIFLKMPEGHQG